ncbi:MAG: phosphatase PAP2 family protein [Thermoanaerobaculia bacterium]
MKNFFACGRLRSTVTPRQRPGQVSAALIGLAVILFPLPLQALETQAAAKVEESVRPETADSRRTLKRFPKNLLRGAGGVFSGESVGPLLTGTFIAGLGLAFDDNVRDAIADEDDQVAEFANSNLGPVGLGVAVLGLFVGGRFADSPQFRDMTYDLGEAAVVNLAFTGLLKAATSRERPNKTDDDSFPSGHTSNAFALATVLTKHYGRKIGPSAYIGATLVGASRLRSNAHWLTDVTVGATLGYLVGRSVVRRNNRGLKNEAAEKINFVVVPSISPSVQGLTVTVNF